MQVKTIASILLLLVVVPGMAQPAELRYSTFFTGGTCANSDKVDVCMQTRADWPAIYNDALAGKYTAQRTVATCFATSCSNAILKKKAMACAWYSVIAASRGAAATAEDKDNLDQSCAKATLNDAERADADAIAVQLLALIADRRR